ncbi:MAG: hypothetical protein KBG29_06385 [Pseudomonadales bacterium]|jgi:hypothetical protein|nr:hypothetical protein [Pseudomonadales bacterium]MBP9033506.1 hypothetical protein [Pseudomonadales bacterium]
MIHKLLHPHRLYALFKYAVYLALLWNVWLFFEEDWNASVVLLDTGSGLRRHIEVFAQTIDTVAWLLLLALFELETSVLPDSTLRQRRVQWTLHGIRGACALVILNSLAGYAGKFLGYLDAEPLQAGACTLAQSGWFVLQALDDFGALDASNCAALGGGELYRLRAENIVAPAAVLAQSRHLALLDVVNAAAWILVVLLLEAEVRLQVRNTLGGVLLRLGAALKSLVYAVLLCAALYWGFVGDFLDFWDAFLWLLAFVFIELNIFQWQKETAQLARAPVVRA